MAYPTRNNADSDRFLPLLRSRVDSYPSETSVSKRSKDDVFCEHCQRCVSVKTYKRHRDLYYAESRAEWTTNEQLSVSPKSIPSYATDSDNPPDLPVEMDAGSTVADFNVAHTSVPRTWECSSEQVLDEESHTEVGHITCQYSSEEEENDTDDDEIEEMWEDADEVNCDFLEDPDIQCPESDNAPSLPLDSSHDPARQSITALKSWLIGFILLLQARYSTSDALVDALLKFLIVFLSFLGRFSTFVASLARAIPSSLYALKKLQHHESAEIQKFVVCPKCHHLYHFKNCVLVSRGLEYTRTCEFVRFPNHSQKKQRAACGAALLKTVFLPSGRRLLYPRKVYPYKTLLSSMQEIVLRPGFSELCNQWKHREPTQLAKDVYDGQIWRDFQNVDGKAFLSSDESLCLGLMLNVDWFQPYKHTTYSVGAIYLTIMNLPRLVRFKRSNVILIGILPGPSEPKRNINSYIDPVVEELLTFWEGVRLPTQSSNCTEMSRTLVRCALLSVACDLPAGRKLCGFMGHSARLGCSKCYKQFLGSVGSMNYSGFDRATWQYRSDAEHRQRVNHVQRAKTRQEQAMLESRYGCRYSGLLKLPYFDAPRMLTVDPMHNLFLGTGKHILQYWLLHYIIPKNKYSYVQDYVDRMVVPCDVGRIPHKIISGFSGFTADQFKNWLIIFSIPSLFGIIPQRDLECFRCFVLACRILCKQQLSRNDIILFDALLLQFCRRVQELYGDAFVTPNMHMHCHLRQAVEDYGPVFGFWLFSFERYNGILGSQSHNNRDIEYQLLCRFVRDNFVFSYNFPQLYHDDFSTVCSVDRETVGSLRDTSADSSHTAVLPKQSRKHVLDSDDIDFLLQLLGKLNPTLSSASLSVNRVYAQYSSVTFRGNRYTTSRASKPFICMAQWDCNLFGSPPTPLEDPTHPDSTLRPAQVRSYIKVSYNLQLRDDLPKQEHLLLAVVSWLLPHPLKNTMGKPTQVWHHNRYESGGITSFVPVRYLRSRCCHCVTVVKDETVMVIVPLVE